jgi:hypothetical protein
MENQTHAKQRIIKYIPTYIDLLSHFTIHMYSNVFRHTHSLFANVYYLSTSFDLKYRSIRGKCTRTLMNTETKYHDQMVLSCELCVNEYIFIHMSDTPTVMIHVKVYYSHYFMATITLPLNFSISPKIFLFLPSIPPQPLKGLWLDLIFFPSRMQF